jgi:hypothetical protein
MKLCLFSFLVFFVVRITVAQKYEGFIDDKLIWFEVKNNQLDGIYTSYIKTFDYKGEILYWPSVTGSFSKGQRVGKWELFDEKGTLIFERNYEDLFDFDQVLPKLPDNDAIELLPKPIYVAVKDSNDLYVYYPLQEREVALSNRAWRELLPDANAELVNQHIFNDLLLKLANGEITAYNHEQFLDTVSRITFKDLTNLELVSFRIKEDFFIDNTRQLSETRIIGLCPVVKKSEDAEPEELCWLYYPYIRPFLSTYEIISNNPKIENLENLIFYRQINGKVYKDTHIHSNISEYAKIHPALYDCMQFELEHDYWKQITGN